jgi:hypothetical protein
MLLLPTASWLPLTTTVACAVPPVTVNVAEPSAVLPKLKATVPVGVPLAAVTAAVKVVDAVVAMALELAVTAVVVGMRT